MAEPARLRHVARLLRAGVYKEDSQALGSRTIDGDPTCADVEGHQVRAYYQRALIGLPCLRHDISDTRCRRRRGSESRYMCVGGELGMGPGEYGSGLVRCSVDCKNFLKCRKFEQFLARYEHLVD